MEAGERLSNTGLPQSRTTAHADPPAPPQCRGAAATHHTNHPGLPGRFGPRIDVPAVAMHGDAYRILLIEACEGPEGPGPDAMPPSWLDMIGRSSVESAGIPPGDRRARRTQRPGKRIGGNHMAYGVVHRFAGGTREQYEASIAAVHPPGGGLPEGQLFHAAGPSADGWTIIAVHDSREGWERFRDGILIPRMTEGIVGGFKAPPEETGFEIYNEVTA